MFRRNGYVTDSDDEEISEMDISKVASEIASPCSNKMSMTIQFSSDDDEEEEEDDDDDDHNSIPFKKSENELQLANDVQNMSIQNESVLSEVESDISSFASDDGNMKHSDIINSPPAQFTPPLARSSILPTYSHVKQIATISQSNTHERAQHIPLVEIESDEDSEIIGDSFTQEKSVPAKISYGNRSDDVQVVPESEESTASTLSVASSSSYKGGILKEAVVKKLANSLSSNSQGTINNSGSMHSTNSSTSSQSEMRNLKRQLDEKALAFRNLEHAQKNCNRKILKDGGKLLDEKVERCRYELQELKKRYGDISAELDDDIQIVAAVKKEIIFSTKDQNIAHLGQKGLETHRLEKALTMDALVSLHSSLATTPAQDAMEEPPDGLTVPLMPHQLKALAWLLHREKQLPAGGILADDMGLGKTLTMISLVLKSAENRHDENEKPPWQSKKTSGTLHPGKTLVVCPASLINQWEGQVKQHVRRGKLTTLVHHGTNREGRGSRLVGADIVITTYGVIAQEHKSKVAVFRVAWDRVILDEAHTIRNHKTQNAVAACELEAKHRWCLTGTPVHNKELDIYSLLKFLRCAPFDDLMVWKRWVDNKTPAGTERLNTVVKSILLRRTKQELQSEGGLLELSTKQIHHLRFELDKHEFKVYENVMNLSKTLLAQYLQQRAEKGDAGLMSAGIQRLQSQLQQVQDVKTHEILVLLLRLRQICCLPGLINSLLEEDAAAADGFEKKDAVVEDLFKQVRRLTISAPVAEEEPPVDVEKVLVTSNPVFSLSRPSSKMRLLMSTLQEILDTGDKVVVVSQWANFLRHLHNHLKNLDVQIATLDGSIPVKNRGAIVDKFNDPKSSLRVLLLSLTAGGVGLNLIGGNHLIILEPHWNPQLESQACDRVYRVGQRKPVHIYKVISKDTIEERIENLQEKKLAMAANLLAGNLKKESCKLTLDDLKSLFGCS